MRCYLITFIKIYVVYIRARVGYFLFFFFHFVYIEVGLVAFARFGDIYELCLRMFFSRLEKKNYSILLLGFHFVSLHRNEKNLPESTSTLFIVVRISCVYVLACVYVCVVCACLRACVCFFVFFFCMRVTSFFFLSCNYSNGNSLLHSFVAAIMRSYRTRRIIQLINKC